MALPGTECTHGAETTDKDTVMHIPGHSELEVPRAKEAPLPVWKIPSQWMKKSPAVERRGCRSAPRRDTCTKMPHWKNLKLSKTPSSYINRYTREYAEKGPEGYTPASHQWKYLRFKAKLFVAFFFFKNKVFMFYM